MEELKINIRELMGKVKHPDETLATRLMLENMGNNNMLSDVGKLRYTDGYKPVKHLFKPLTKPFCDNIMLAKILDFSDCDGVYGGKFLVKELVCGGNNSILRSKFASEKIQLAPWGVKAKLPTVFNFSECNFVSREQKQAIKERFTQPVILKYKVELANTDLRVLMPKLGKILRELIKDYFYLMDFDITQDFTGIFDKREMERYLINNFDFVLEGKGKKRIVDNDTNVGMDCLSWVYDGVRAKIYNKFVCQMTSPGVTKGIGNHIVNFICCPDERLQNTFASAGARQHGVTRFEATIYVNNGKVEFTRVLTNNLAYFQSAPFYSVSMRKMWNKILDSVENNMLVIYKNEIFLGLWGNSLTKKITGYRIEIKDENFKLKLRDFAISALSLNVVPIYCISIDDDHSVVASCCVKSGCTFFTRGNSVFYTPFRKNIDFEHCDFNFNAALGNHEKCYPSIFSRKLQKKCKLDMFGDFREIPLDKQLFVKRFEKIKKETEHMFYLQKQRDYRSTATFDREKWKKWFEEKARKARLEKSLQSFFKQIWCEPPQHSEVLCCAFKIRDYTDYCKIGVFGTVNGKKSVFYVKGQFKNAFLRMFKIDAAKLKVRGFRMIEDNIWFYPFGDFLVLKTTGETSYKGHVYTNVSYSSKVNWINRECQNAIAEENRKMQSFELVRFSVDHVTLKSCKRLEELKKNFEFVISFMGEKEFRGRTRYIFRVDGLDEYVVSNFWFEKLYEELDKNINLKCKLCEVKTTPSKHKERLVLLSNI